MGKGKTRILTAYDQKQEAKLNRWVAANRDIIYYLMASPEALENLRNAANTRLSSTDMEKQEEVGEMYFLEEERCFLESEMPESKAAIRRSAPRRRKK